MPRAAGSGLPSGRGEGTGAALCRPPAAACPRHSLACRLADHHRRAQTGRWRTGGERGGEEEIWRGGGEMVKCRGLKEGSVVEER